MAKYAAVGASLTIDSMPIPNFLSVSSTSSEAEKIDVTTLDSPAGAREFVAGFQGEKSISFELLYDPNDSAHQHLAALAASREVVPGSIGLPSSPAATITFSGYVSNFPPPNLPVGGAMSMTVTMQLSGEIVMPGAGGTGGS